MPSIIELAARITENTNQVHEYMTKNNIAIPSFDVDSPLSWDIPYEATEILAARKTAIDATTELQARLLGPREHFAELTQFYTRLIPIHAIVRFKLSKVVPIDGDITIEELARHSGVNEQSLRRLLRFAIDLKFFEYSKPNYIRHSVLSRMLAEDVYLYDCAATLSDIMWPSGAHMIDALAKFPGSQEPNETGFNLAHETSLTLYQYLEQHPQRARQFGNAMEFFAQGNPAFSLDHIVNGFDWKNLGNGLIVDVGGSNGFVAIALAESFPSLTCIVQDLPAVVKDMEVPANLVGRVTFAAHDFSNVQPVKDADVYFFRWILHNWPDKYAIQILQNLIPALKAGARIIVCDEILPPHGVLPIDIEMTLMQLDTSMAAIQNAKLRSAEEWEHLFQQADSRFTFKGITMPPGSALGLVEIEWTSAR